MSHRVHQAMRRLALTSAVASEAKGGALGIDPRMLRALSHPLRLRILELLSRVKEASPKDMAADLGCPLSNVAYHTKVLYEDCGFLDLVRTVPRRGAEEHFYRVKSDPFMWTARPASIPPALRGGVAAEALRRLNDKAVSALEIGTFQGRDEATLSCARLTVDEEGWRELHETIHGLPERFQEIQANSARRLAGEPGLEVAVGAHSFEVPSSPADSAP